MSRTNILCVGGKFDKDGGRKSSYFKQLMGHTLSQIDYDKVIMVNGGSIDTLNRIFERSFPENEIHDSNIIFWFADVPNDVPKMVHKIKQMNKKCILITSKNNLDGKYSKMHLIARMLKVKSNLLVEFTSSNVPKRYAGTILDPLGNVYGHVEGICGHVGMAKITNIKVLGKRLGKRVQELVNFTRMPSIPANADKMPIPVPDKKEFFDIVKVHAETFHNLIHGVEHSRFLGNCSFRCENGFPSFKYNNLIYVSKRNIDKREIGLDGFIAVEPKINITNGKRHISFYGSKDKPSVDTPIQIQLYEMFPNIAYMLHSHVYVDKNTDIKLFETTKPIPCGAMEEVDEIKEVVGNEADGLDEFAINLKGHGSLVLSNNVETFKKIKYVAREFPEVNNEY